MKEKIKGLLLKRLIKKLPLLEICKNFFEYKDYLPQKVVNVLQSLCEEGFFQVSKNSYISFEGKGKFQGINDEEAFPISTLEELEEFLREEGYLD